MAPTVDMNKSSGRFVFPFYIDQDRFAPDDIVESIDSATRPGRDDRQMKVWEREDRYDNVEVLPHLKRYINPREDTGAYRTVNFWKLSGFMLQSPKALGAGSGGQQSWTIGSTYANPPVDIEFDLEQVELALFSTAGVGLLTILAKPTVNDLESWLSFVHFFRFAHGQRRVSLTVPREDQQGQPQPFVPFQIDDHEDGSNEFTLSRVIEHLLDSISASDGEERWWAPALDRARLLSYMVLLVDDVPDDQIPALSYQLRNAFHSRQIVSTGHTPHPSSNPNALELGNKQWMLFSIGGGAFLGCDVQARTFHRDNFPRTLGCEYYLLYLVVLQQRFGLIFLSEQVARDWLGKDASVRKHAFARIRDRLMEFTARGFFSQVMLEERHHMTYQKWQSIFQVRDLWQEVNDEVREMYYDAVLQQNEMAEQLQRSRERVRHSRDRRVQVFFGLLATVLGGPGVALATLEVGGMQGWYWAAGGFVAGLSLMAAVVLVLIRSRFTTWVNDTLLTPGGNLDDHSHYGSVHGGLLTQSDIARD